VERSLCQQLVGLVLLAAIADTAAAAPRWELTIEASPSLAAAASRVQSVDSQLIAQALARAGLELPLAVHVTLIPEEDPLARRMPDWIVARAFGSRDVVIVPQRVAAYPYDSLESVVRHEVVHLALFARADGRPLPRWFHEGVAVSVEAGWGFTDNLKLLLAAGSGPAVADVARLFQSDARPETERAYRLAAALVDDLRRRHGAALPGAIASHVARGTPFVRAFELETGETPDEAAAHAWATYRRWTTWLPFVTSGSALWTAIMALAFVAFFARLVQRARRRREWNDEDPV
jgi:hypothetical protein